MNDAGSWIWLKACNALGVPVLNEDLCMPEACAAIQAFLSGGGIVPDIYAHHCVFFYLPSSACTLRAEGWQTCSPCMPQ